MLLNTYNDFSNLTPSTTAVRTYRLDCSQARMHCAGKLSAITLAGSDQRREESETLAVGSDTFHTSMGKYPLVEEKEISTGTTVIFLLLAVTPKREVATSVYAVRCLGVSLKAPDGSIDGVTELGNYRARERKRRPEKGQRRKPADNLPGADLRRGVVRLAWEAPRPGPCRLRGPSASPVLS